MGAMQLAVATREDAKTVDPADLVAAMDARTKTSAALARALEVDDTTVYRWRKGESPITQVIWLAVLHALDLPRGWKAGDPVPAKPKAKRKPDA